MVERNPVFIPATIQKGLVCPKCGSDKFEGRRIQNTIVRTCSNKDCRQEWAGGYGMSPAAQDPRVPVAPEIYQPALKFVADGKGQVEEIRRKVDPTPDFKKGALIPPDGEENG